MVTGHETRRVARPIAVPAEVAALDVVPAVAPAAPDADATMPLAGGPGAAHGGAAPAASATPGEHADGANPHQRLRLYIWQVPVRITHWVTALAIVTLSVTGAYIADPFLIPPGGSVMTTIRLIHMITAFVFLASGVIRTVYLLRGNRFARWSAFIPTSWFQLTELFRQAGFYAFIRREIPKVLGHNQLAATAYVALFVLLLTETVTGFALDGLVGGEPGNAGFGWLRELIGPQTIRMIHHFSMWAILAIAIFHVYSCVLVDHIEHNGLLSSIFSGYKFPTREEILESRDGGPEILARAVED